MDRRLVIGVFAVVVVSAGAGLSAILISNQNHAADERTLEEQLRLARIEGLPTTWQEYAATIKPAKLAENAAPLYRELENKPSSSSRGTSSLDLLKDATPKVVAEVLAYLRSRSSYFRVVDEAVKKPRCWFNRDWSKGYASTYHELEAMRDCAAELELRGTYYATIGQPKQALKNADDMLRVMLHIEDDRSNLSQFDAYAVRERTISALAMWAYRHREEPAYLQSLKNALDTMPNFDMRRFHLGDLYLLRLSVKESTTPEGRKSLGLEPGDESTSEKLAPYVTSRVKSDIDIVKAERLAWAALLRPASQRLNMVEQAQSELQTALLAYPAVAKLYEQFGGPILVDTYFYDERDEAIKLEYRALIRALSQRAIPKAIKTSDLLSPYDGKPLTYSYDGRQITISVSCPQNEYGVRALKFPPSNVINASGEAKS